MKSVQRQVIRRFAVMLAVGATACTATSAPAHISAGGIRTRIPSPAQKHVCRSAALGPRRFTVRAGGVRRSYLLRAPGLVGRGRLVVLFHGFDQTAESIDAYTLLPRVGAAAGFAVATPQGVDDRWNFPRRAAVGPNDVDFVRKMVAAIARRICINSSQVFAAGFSDGADMADTVACFDHQIRAVAGVAASVTVAGCRHRVDVVQIHGDADPVVPFDGGGGDRSPPFEGTEAVSVFRQMQTWRAVDGCPADRSVRREAPSGVTVIRAVGCPAGRRVVLIVVRGGGHTWPGATVNLPFGDTNHSYRASREILAFFEHVLHE